MIRRKRNSHQGTLGSLSSGTMKSDDLIPVFASELRSLARKGTKHKQLAYNAERALSKAQGLMDHEDSSDAWERCDEFLDELFDALQEYAPAYAYFGAHPGDGADYGFWLSESFTEDFDGLKVDDLSEVPNSYRGEVLHVNDHGNMTLYVTARGKFREVWAIV